MLDTNKDGKISLEEFSAWYYASQDRMEKELVDVFHLVSH
jgi:Ca2+-binding EF-hand superfamily protein